MAGHPGLRQVCHFIGRAFFWPHLESDECSNAGSYSACKRSGTSSRLMRQVKVFFASRPFDFIAADIVGPSLRSVNSNQYVTIMSNRYSMHGVAYDREVHGIIHRAWRKTLNHDRIPPADKRAGKTETSYHNHSTAGLYLQKGKILSNKRASGSTRKNRADANVHKYNSS